MSHSTPDIVDREEAPNPYLDRKVYRLLDQRGFTAGPSNLYGTPRTQLIEHNDIYKE